MFPQIRPYNCELYFDSSEPLKEIVAPRWSRDWDARDYCSHRLTMMMNRAVMRKDLSEFNGIELIGDGGDWLDAFILRWQGDTPILLLTQLPKILRSFRNYIADLNVHMCIQIADYLYEYRFCELNNHASWLAYNMLLFGAMFSMKYTLYGQLLFEECLKQVKDNGSQPLEEKRRAEAVGHYCQMNLEALILCHQALGRGLPMNVLNAIDRLPDWSFIKHSDKFTGLPEGSHVMYVESGKLN